MFCPGRRVSRLTAIRGKSPRRSRSRRYSRGRKRTCDADEKNYAYERSEESGRGRARDGEDERMCTRGARYREPFSLIPRDWWRLDGFLSRPARRQVITVGRQAVAPGILPGRISAETSRATMRTNPGRGRYNEKQRRRAGRYSMIATDCVKYPPRVDGVPRDWVVDVETCNGANEEKGVKARGREQWVAGTRASV